MILPDEQKVLETVDEIRIKFQSKKKMTKGNLRKYGIKQELKNSMKTISNTRGPEE